jgi:hypothetical protein
VEYQVEIERAAQVAKQVISDATEEAAKVIANAANEAIMVLDQKNTGSSCDHDLLMRVDTKVDRLKDDIKDINLGMSSVIRDVCSRVEKLEITIIKDGEKRLNALEVSRGYVTVMLTIGCGLLTFLSSLMVYHLIMK